METMSRRFPEVTTEEHEFLQGTIREAYELFLDELDKSHCRYGFPVRTFACLRCCNIRLLSSLAVFPEYMQLDLMHLYVNETGNAPRIIRG